MANRGGAGFCRRCGQRLAAVSLRAGKLEPSEVDFVSLKGRFRRPPVMVNGMLLALATDGALHQVSPRTGGQARIVGTVGARGAGLNRGATARITGEGSSVQGWAYLAASQDGISVTSLATGTTEMLDRPGPGEEISANRLESEATGFRGMVANDEVYAFATATSTEDSDFILTVRPFSRDRPAMRPLAVHGSRLAGPVLHDELIVICTEQEAGIYDVAGRVAQRMALPRGFAALTRPSSVEMSVAPGSIPIVGTRGRDGSLKATIAGHQDGASGTLELDFKRKTGEFHRRPAGTSIYSNADGSLSIGTLDRIERLGRENSIDRVSSLEPGMPAGAEGDLRLWFAEQQYTGNHRVVMSRGTQTIDVAFSDPGCTKDTCCGIYFAGEDVVVASLRDAGNDGTGMRLARWSLR